MSLTFTHCWICGGHWNDVMYAYDGPCCFGGKIAHIPKCSCGYPDRPCARSQTDCTYIQPRREPTSAGT